MYQCACGSTFKTEEACWSHKDTEKHWTQLEWIVSIEKQKKDVKVKEATMLNATDDVQDRGTSSQTSNEKMGADNEKMDAVIEKTGNLIEEMGAVIDKVHSLSCKIDELNEKMKHIDNKIKSLKIDELNEKMGRIESKIETLIWEWS